MFVSGRDFNVQGLHRLTLRVGTPQRKGSVGRVAKFSQTLCGLFGAPCMEAETNEQKDRQLTGEANAHERSCLETLLGGMEQVQQEEQQKQSKGAKKRGRG